MKASAMQVMDKHLQLLAQQHLETKFVKVGSIPRCSQATCLQGLSAGNQLHMRRPQSQGAQTDIGLPCAQINAEKSPYLVERLKIWMLPTLALIRQEKTVDYVVGFDDMGGKDDFSTEVDTQISRSQTIRPSREGPTASCVSDDKACSQSGHRASKSALLRAIMRVLSVLKVHALLGCSCHTQCALALCMSCCSADSVNVMCRCWRTG